MSGLLDAISDAAQFHMGTDLVDRLQLVQKIMAAKNDVLNQAADEIRRLEARVKELEQQGNSASPPIPSPTVNATGAIQ